MTTVLLALSFLAGTAAISLQDRLVTVPAGDSYVVIGPGLIVLGVLAALLVAARIAAPRVVMAVMVACVPAVAVANLAVDVARDPTAHNLWPLELVFGLVAGAVPVLAGAVLGLMLRRLNDGRW